MMGDTHPQRDKGEREQKKARLRYMKDIMRDETRSFLCALFLHWLFKKSNSSDCLRAGIGVYCFIPFSPMKQNRHRGLTAPVYRPHRVRQCGPVVERRPRLRRFQRHRVLDAVGNNLAFLCEQDNILVPRPTGAKKRKNDRKRHT